MFPVEGGRLFCGHAYGRVIEELASRYREIVLCLDTDQREQRREDVMLPTNVMLIPTPGSVRAIDGLLRRSAYADAYRKTISAADEVLVRGVLNPSVDVLYEECRKQDKPVCHWLVGNPMGLLKSHRRFGRVKNAVGKAFVYIWEQQLHRGHNNARAAYLCNGYEIAKRHPSDSTYVTVSTTLTDADLYRRPDTCQNRTIRILSLCYVRPEKGIEYLIEAFARLKTTGATELVLVGSRDRYPAYQAKLDRLVAQNGLQERVTWAGHATYSEVKKFMQAADIFAFPTLSEGTPRVLVEARANSLPVVSTNVGGIPDSVKNGHDGLLVPPKAPQEMANAIDKIIADASLRRKLIANGFESAKGLTVARFASQIVDIFAEL